MVATSLIHGVPEMLHDLIQRLDLIDTVLSILATAGSGLAVWYRKNLQSGLRFWRDVFRGLRSINELKESVSKISYFVAPNGGGSLMDAARRTETAVATLSGQMDLVVQTMLVENDINDEVAQFHANRLGEFTYVNQLYARWLAVGKDDLLDWGYLNFIHPDDFDRVTRHWEQCRREHRECQLRFRMVASTGSVVSVRVVARPIMKGDQVTRWIGFIRRTDNAQKT